MGHPANQELGITKSHFIGHVVTREQVETLSREHEDESLSGRSLLVSPTQPQTSIKCCKTLLHACHEAPKKVVYKEEIKIGMQRSDNTCGRSRTVAHASVRTLHGTFQIALGLLQRRFYITYSLNYKGSRSVNSLFSC